jgi:hypothetical protein
MMKTYKVTIAVDSLDPNPTVKVFDLFDEASDYIHESVEQSVQWRVDHSPYTITEEEREMMYEEEFQLCLLEEIS